MYKLPHHHKKKKKKKTKKAKQNKKTQPTNQTNKQKKPKNPCDDLHMLNPGSGTIKRCGLVEVGVSQWGWA